MSAHPAARAAAPAALPSPSSFASEVTGTSRGTADEPTLKKKKKLLNGANIKFTFPSGATYNGSFKDGRIEGYGVYTYAKTGDVYEGEWKADLKHGHGSYVFANGDRYVGQWYMGHKHGKGLFVFANGDEYVGSWTNNQMNGYGTFLLASNGDRYEGYWKEGIRQGQGTLYHDNGDMYDGEWTSGHESGLGVFFQSNSDLYCGQWSDGAMDGKGVLREKGILYLVEYVGGYLISKMKQSEALEETEKEWASVYKHYLSWIGHHDAPDAPKRSKKDEDKLGDELQAARAEINILRKRIEGLLALNQPKGRPGDGGADAHAASHRAAVEEAHTEYRKETVRMLENKVKLLECTLAERAVETRKLVDQLKSSEAKVQELALKDASHQLRLRDTRQSSAKTVSAPSPSYATPSPPTADEAVYIDADEVEELREQNDILAHVNEELQRKAAFLAAENAKLALKEEAAEEQYDKLAEELAEVKKALENERSASKGSQPVSNGETIPTVPSPTSLSLGSVKTADAEEVQHKLIQANQLNIELRLKVGDLERRAQAKSTAAGPVNSAAEAAGLTQENESLRSLVTDLKARLATMQAASDNAEQKIVRAQQRQVELEEAIRTITYRKAANPQLQESLEQKSERITKLEHENAHLARLLDETRADAEESKRAVAKLQRRRSSELQTVDGATDELALAQKEMRKAQKRLKKVTAERNSVAEQFYESQVRLARTDRALGALQGQVVVFAAVADSGSSVNGSSSAPADTAARVDSADPSKLVLRDCGEEVVHQYDYCFDRDASADQVFAELCDPLAFVWSGYQCALMTVGELRSGKTSLVRELLPLFTRFLSKAAEGDPKRFFFSFTYRVAVVEVSARGGFDCASGDDLTEVCYDANGFAQPRNVRFIDCTSGSIVGVVHSLLAKRRQHHNGRSHTWIQLQCVRTSVARQSQSVGRLTLFDWCGGGSLASQKTDIESARFANTSNQQLRDLAAALANKLPVIPYNKSVEAALLFDLLGGNSVTAVVGRIRPAVEHVEETLRTLQVLTSLYGVRNGPLLPDNQTSDEIRWRGIVAALSSDHQAEREMRVVDNIREC
ncbi:phosphatidylinositol-4-phosphate 5-kinase-like protein [Novymonas esmeraldas]|uniref:Phosphatidylinositol-4-phosphate 5-kinase-like protein n=1 Tax=Novymonas esmeraldas TaxID=1808958 RepID=A0AAW0F7G1_9TRYP